MVNANPGRPIIPTIWLLIIGGGEPALLPEVKVREDGVAGWPVPNQQQILIIKEDGGKILPSVLLRQTQEEHLAGTEHPVDHAQHGVIQGVIGRVEILAGTIVTLAEADLAEVHSIREAVRLEAVAEVADLLVVVQLVEVPVIHQGVPAEEINPVHIIIP